MKRKLLWAVLILFILALYVIIVDSLQPPREEYDHRVSEEIKALMRKHGPLYLYVHTETEFYYVLPDGSKHYFRRNK